MRGTFLKNKPDGNCEIDYADQSTYKGELKLGLKDGRGILIDVTRRLNYSGQWAQNMMNGNFKNSPKVLVC